MYMLNYFCLYRRYFVNKFEPGHSIFHKIAFAPSEDSDQPAHPRSLIRVTAWLSLDIKLFKSV